MACGSCGKRKLRADGSPAGEPTGPGTRVVFYAFGPNGEEEAGRTLYEARQIARRGGRGWEIAGRHEAVG